VTGLSRIEVIKRICETSPASSAMFATTGETAREALKAGVENRKFFPCVGGMGHASSVAIGYALQTDKQTICLDGDGALLMHLGALSSITSSVSARFFHFLFDNGCHLSVGGNKTSGGHLDYLEIAESMKYGKVDKVENLDQVNEFFSVEAGSKPLTRFIYVKVHAERERDLPRPVNLSLFVDIFAEDWY